MHYRCRHISPVLSLTSCRLPPASPWSQFLLFLCTPNCIWSWTCGTLRAKCHCGVDISATPPPAWNPRSRISLLDPNFSSVSQPIIVGPAGFVRLQVTTPHTFVPSHNNSSRGSNRRSTLYRWSSFWYGIIRLKFLSLQFLAKCPYLSYNQHSVSVFSSLYNCPTPRLRSPYRLFYIS